MSLDRSMRVFIILVYLVLSASAVACGDDESETPTTEDAAPCDDRGRVAGIAGRVAAPSCESAVGFAEVVLFDQLMFERATTDADGNGEFAFSASEAGGDDIYLIRATKGSFSGTTDQPFEMSGGQSDFQIVKVGQ